jgi:hypothetical protein
MTKKEKQKAIMALFKERQAEMGGPLRTTYQEMANWLSAPLPEPITRQNVHNWLNGECVPYRTKFYQILDRSHEDTSQYRFAKKVLNVLCEGGVP